MEFSSSNNLTDIETKPQQYLPFVGTLYFITILFTQRTKAHESESYILHECRRPCLQFPFSCVKVWTPPAYPPTSPCYSEKNRDPVTCINTEIFCRVATRQTILHAKSRLFVAEIPWRWPTYLVKRYSATCCHLTEDPDSAPNDVSGQNRRDIVFAEIT